MDELHNVSAQSPSNNDGLFYNTTTSLWEKKSIATVLGYTPANAARSLTINGTAYDLTADRSWIVGTVTSVAALTLGTTGSDVSSSVATGTTTPVITLNIPTASGTNRGALSSTDWTTFNGKQNALSGTGFVKISGTTISYDNSTYYLASNPDGYTTNVGTVTSVALSVPTGLSITGSPITTSGTLALTYAAGYSIPTDAIQTNWTTAYTNRITSLTTTGSSGASTLVSNVLNIPNYTLAGLGGVPTSRSLTINGTAYDLSADRSWTITTDANSRNLQDFTATAGQTTFTVTGGYVVGLLDVYVNGSKLTSSEFTATNGTTFVLTIASTVGDQVQSINYKASVNGISGAGTANYVPKFTASGTIGNSSIFDNGTNVGIGTITPTGYSSRSLNIFGSASAELHITTTGSGTLQSDGLSIGLRDSDGSAQLILRDNSFMAFGTNDSERMRITNLGNILVNTSTNNNLGNDGNKGITINSGGAALASFISFRTSNSDRGIMYANDTEMLIGSQTNIPLLFYTNNSEKMKITSAGRILCSGDVWGTERFGVVLDSSLASSTGITAYMNNTSYTGSLIRVQAETVGNTSWYGYELRAQGVIKYGIYGNGSVTAPSDERRKKNIETTREGYLKDLCDLRVVKYNWKDDEEGKDRELGFIAQEVEKIFPKLVETGHDGLNNENEVKLLKQGVLVPILVKAIQELSAKVTLLENK
jgi:hypothetical protein